MASDVTVNTALQQQARTSNSSAQLADDFDQFLQLLTVQLLGMEPLLAGKRLGLAHIVFASMH